MAKLNFNILLCDVFNNVVNDPDFSSIYNKHILSIANDYEEGGWRHGNFYNFIWNNMAQTALSAQEREKLVDDNYTLLLQAASNLRLTDSPKDSGKGSEIAEIILYGLMKHHYKALPVVPKIFYKQNPNDTVKGADSVHIVLDANGDFSLWLGEAKFFVGLDDARLKSVVESVENTLSGKALKKEKHIILNLKDLDTLILDDATKAEIKSLLASEISIDKLKPKLNIPIFILYQCDITNAANSYNQDYIDEIVNYQKKKATTYFKKQLELSSIIHGYSTVHFHIILLPVPDKAEIVDYYIKKAKSFGDYQ